MKTEVELREEELEAVRMFKCDERVEMDAELDLERARASEEFRKKAEMIKEWKRELLWNLATGRRMH